MNIKSVASWSALAGFAFLVASPAAVANLTASRLVVHHYSAGSLDDAGYLGNMRPGTLGSGATLVQPSGGNPGYVNLSGGGDGTSNVTFDTTGSDSDNLNSRIEPSSDATVEIWLDFDASNTKNTGDGNSRFNIFAGGSEHSDMRFFFDHRGTNSDDAQRVGGYKEGDLINGSYSSLNEGLVSRANTEGRHQWVFVLDGNGPSANGSFSVFRDGVLLADPTFGETYKSAGATIFGLAGSPREFAVGGETSVRPDVFGVGPKGKLYKFAIYNKALSAAEVASTYSSGLAIPEPTALSLLSLGSLVLLGRRRSR